MTCFIVIEQAFVHTSTAYSNCNRFEIDEAVYSPPLQPNQILEAMEYVSAVSLLHFACNDKFVWVLIMRLCTIAIYAIQLILIYFVVFQSDWFAQSVGALFRWVALFRLLPISS